MPSDSFLKACIATGDYGLSDRHPTMYMIQFSRAPVKESSQVKKGYLKDHGEWA